MRHRTCIKRLVGCMAVLALLGLGSCGSDGEPLFSGLVIEGSTAATPLPDGATPATQYPSNVVVTTPNTSIKSMTVLLSLSHEKAQDIDVLLVGPTGVKVMLMSDCFGDHSFSSQLLSFSNTSTTPVPTTTVTPPGETYQPTDNDPGGDSDAFSGPAPVGPYSSNLGDFIGTNPNGTWSLFIEDDTSNLTLVGELAGWQLWLNTE